MTVRESAYATTVTAGSKMHDIDEKLQVQRATNGFMSLNKRAVDEGGSIVVDENVYLGGIAIIPPGPMCANIPPFAHPYPLRTKTGELSQVVIDVRPYTKAKDAYGDWAVRVPYEYNFMIIQAVLEYIWVTEAQTHLQSLSKLPVKLYARWIADNLARRLGLDPETQVTVAIIAAAFYLELFVDGEFTPVEKNRNIAIISTAVMASAQLVERTLSQLEGPIDTLDGLVAAIKDITGSARLEGLNVPILLTATTGVWYGNHGRELAGIALEHPPTWIAMLLAAATERGYRQSGLAKLFYRTESKDVEQLLTAVFGLLRE